jgi:glycosyltransferase involved in cell wall biosynthesis
MELADRVLHSRPEAVGHSIRYRGVAPDRARYVPLTVDPVTEPAIDRASLGVPEGVTLSISAAGFHKTVPDGYWNFGKMLGQLLEAEPNHHHLQVGGGLRRHRWHLTRALGHYSQDVRSRVHWLGTRSDLPALFGAADFLLDSAPVTGSTIRIQAMAAGLPVIATHHASNPLMSCITLFDEDYPLIATSSNEAVRLARELIHQPALREQAGRDLAERYAAEFAPDLLRSRLEALFAGDDEPPVEEPAERDYDLQKLAGLSGPVPSAAALLRRARVWLGDPSAGPRDSILRRADQAVSALRGVGRS